MTMGLRFRMPFKMAVATLSGEILGEIQANFKSSIMTVSTRPGSTFVTEMPLS